MNEDRPIDAWRTEPRTQAEWERYIEAEQERLDREHGVIGSLRELDGFRIVGLERWKPGVVRYLAIRESGAGAESRMGYAKDSVFAMLQLPP